MILKDHLDVGAERTPVFSSASFSSLAFKIGLTLKFRCALRAIVRGLIRSQSDTMYYRKGW